MSTPVEYCSICTISEVDATTTADAYSCKVLNCLCLQYRFIDSIKHYKSALLTGSNKWVFVQFNPQLPLFCIILLYLMLSKRCASLSMNRKLTLNKSKMFIGPDLNVVIL